jgi:hypothetical protein
MAHFTNSSAVLRSPFDRQPRPVLVGQWLIDPRAAGNRLTLLWHVIADASPSQACAA